MMKGILIAVLILSASGVFAGDGFDTSVPVYNCLRIGGEIIVIDGKPNDKAWEKAEQIRIYRDTRTGAQKEFETTAKLLYDDTYLYVSFVMRDNDVVATMDEDDSLLFYEEVAEIFISPSGLKNPDSMPYYEINISPLNRIYDSLIYDYRYETLVKNWEKWKNEYDCEGMIHNVEIVGTLNDKSDTDTLWSVEVAIPFSSIPVTNNMPSTTEGTWRIGLNRIEMANGGEFTTWSPTGTDFHKPSKFGYLIFGR